MTDSVVVPCFEFEDGSVLRDVEITFSTWGELNQDADNVILVCHTLTGNTDVSDWWGDLLGSGKAFDTDRYFVICPSLIGSPYSGFSPLTMNPETGEPYGADFPVATVRDSARLHRQLLEILGVGKVALAIGASLGAMEVLELAIEDDFVETIVPLAVGATHSAWGIAWSETQRQCIFADPKWNGGRYDPEDPPAQGLANARMIAMLSYRSGPAYKARFGRAVSGVNGSTAFDIENYLRYQGQKLVSRFDANCYVSLTRQMNSHDVGRGRGGVESALALIRQPALVIGFDTDFLYPIEEQRELAGHISNARLEIVKGINGHDSFLIEAKQVNALVRDWIAQDEYQETS